MKKLSANTIPPRSGTAKSLVVFLHGYGSNGDDLLGIGHEWAADLPDTAFVAPDAPDVCEAFAGGFQWFSLRAAEIIAAKAVDRLNLAREPAAVLNGFIDEQLAKWGVDDAHLALVGFSQGAMMAMYAAPRRKKPCAAVVGYSGMLVGGEELVGPGIVKMPVLAIHGDMDEVVEPENLKKAEEGLEAAGFEVETVLRHGLAHGIDGFGLMRGMSFIKERFDKV